MINCGGSFMFNYEGGVTVWRDRGRRGHLSLINFNLLIDSILSSLFIKMSCSVDVKYYAAALQPSSWIINKPVST